MDATVWMNTDKVGCTYIIPLLTNWIPLEHDTRCILTHTQTHSIASLQLCTSVGFLMVLHCDMNISVMLDYMLNLVSDL